MMPLKERALVSALSDAKSLREVVQFCTDTGSAKDICKTSKTFWMEMLPKVGYELTAICFEPLKDEYWKQLIKAFSENLYRKYYYIVSEDLVEEEDNPQPEIFYDALQAQDATDFNMKLARSCYIPGIQLESGTVGWIIELFKDDVHLQRNQFILDSGPGDYLYRISLVCAIMLTEVINKKIGEELLDAPYADSYYSLVFDSNIDNVKTKTINVPGIKYYDLTVVERSEVSYKEPISREYFIDLIRMNFLENEETNSVMLGQFVNLYTGKNRGGIGSNIYSSEEAMLFNVQKLRLY